MNEFDRHGWWTDGNGFIRRVSLNDEIKFICWKHFQPVLFWFETFEEAKVAYDNQEIKNEISRTVDEIEEN